MKIDNEVLNALSNAQTIGAMLKLIVQPVGSRDINSMKPRLIINLLIATVRAMHDAVTLAGA